MYKHFSPFLTHAKSLGKDKGPSATSLFDGLTHSTITDLNVPLGLPLLPSQPDTISLLSNHTKVERVSE